MRNFQLSDAAASELWRALNGSTDAPVPAAPVSAVPAGPDAGALAWARSMVAGGLAPPAAFEIVRGTWAKDGHTTPLTFTAADLGTPPATNPDPDKEAREARERAAAAASVADMVPGHWSQAHILAAILNSGAMDAAVSGAIYNTLMASVGLGNAAKCIADTQGAGLASALANIRGGMTVEAAYQNQVASNAANFTQDELAAAWSLAQSLGVV